MKMFMYFTMVDPENKAHEDSERKNTNNQGCLEQCEEDMNNQMNDLNGCLVDFLDKKTF